MFCNKGPFLRAILVHQMENHLVLILSPGTLDQAWIKDLLPSMKALYICTPREFLSYLLPVFSSMLFYSIC
jgi:hypothetical protein